MKQISLLVLLLSLSIFSFGQKERTIAFYNVENLFDTLDTPNKSDSEFLPNGKKEWNSEKYNTKIKHINQVIDAIESPLIIGLCEVENKNVVLDIVKNGQLSCTHAVVHAESRDQRGIDNAIIYDKSALLLEEKGTIRFNIPGDRPTRDILWARFTARKTSFYVMVNHWPSRYGGAEESEPKRMIAAENARLFIDSLIQNDPKVRIIFMGDLNDHPENAAPQMIQEQLSPMITTESGKYQGTHNYRGQWGILDHIMVSDSFLKKRGTRIVKNSGTIHSFNFLIGEYRGNEVPARTYGGKKYLNGYSDHLPVSIKIRL
jgi:predicted extracellular nuclease